MRTASVFTHFRCNQRCGYCTFRRPEDDRDFIRRSAVEARIARALDEGVDEIILTGGEPVMRSDLTGLVAFAKARGARRVTLSTNATLLDDARCDALREAGLDAARVNLVGFDEKVDSVTLDPGGFDATRRGIHALLGAGIEVVIEATIVRSTKHLVAALPERLSSEFGGRLAGLSLVVPTETSDSEEVLAPGEAAEIIGAVAEVSRPVRLPVKLAPETAPPPCAFAEPARVTHLFSMTRGAVARADRRHVEACEACAVSDRCSGFSAATIDRFGVPTVTPIRDDRTRRRLSLISSVEDQVARELVTHDRYWTTAGEVVEEDLVRINFHCNQSCRFCFVSTHLPPAADEAIRAAILDAGRAGRRITLSGGEPTLNADLLAFVRLAKASSPHAVRIQTNAIRLASRELCDAVVDAGVGEAFVSLHGATAEVSDAVTHAPGTFAKTVVGIDHLTARGVNVVLNFVICETNLHELPAYVTLVADRWPDASVNVSFVAPSTDVVPREREFIPRYTDAIPHLAAAFAVARQREVRLVGFESMCGIPLCLVPSEIEAYFALGTVDPGYDRGEFVYPPACEGCELRGRCFGVRRGYVELHGAAELHPVNRAIA